MGGIEEKTTGEPRASVLSSVKGYDCLHKGCQTNLNQIKCYVTCAEYNRCKPYREMLTYKPLTNNAVQIFTK